MPSAELLNWPSLKSLGLVEFIAASPSPVKESTSGMPVVTVVPELVSFVPVVFFPHETARTDEVRSNAINSTRRTAVRVFIFARIV
jgi:hypothetical protein